jgi:hypothetical protein
MATISKPTTFSDGTVPTAAQFNGDFDTIYNEFNGGITNANISPTAAIAESKLAFNTSTGHDHDGVDSKLISVNRAFTWFIEGTQVTGTNLGPRYIVPQNMTIVKAWAIARTGPTGADIIVDINKNGSTIWSTQANRLKIVDGQTTGNTTTFNTTALSAGDYLDFDIDQVGSSVGGVDITIVLECSQP